VTAALATLAFVGFSSAIVCGVQALSSTTAMTCGFASAPASP
jgi:hypothetical protein